MRGRGLPVVVTAFFPALAVFLTVGPLALGFIENFLVTLVALDLMALGVVAFFVTVFFGAAFFLVVFFGVGMVTSSSRRFGLPGSDFVSERVLRVESCGALAAALAGFVLGF